MTPYDTILHAQVEAVGQLIREGKVRAWGLSNETTLGVAQHCATADQLGVPRPVTVQNCYNLVHRMAEVRQAPTKGECNQCMGGWVHASGCTR
jgi:aryl-alcohol dehydrogenase-like predicted oxidoreductase